MSAVRVLLLQLPQILREIFECEIARDPGLELVDDGRPVPLKDRGGPDVVILGTGSTGDKERPMSVLSRWPRARVIVVTPTEGEAALSELRLHTIELGRVSPAEIVRSIRASQPA
jgi:hypothetical protein